jgi:phage-related protein
MAEDITFKIGADTSDFNAALDKADAKVTRLSKNIKASMSTPMGQMPPGKGEEASVIPKLDMPPSLASVRAMEGPMAGIERVGGERWEDILGTPGALNKLPEPDVLERSGGRGGSDMKMLMPFLSIMFAAMAASKALQGLVAPAQEMVKIQEIINTMLGLFFLPIMLWLLDPLFWLFELLLGVDENMQLMIGGFVMFLLIMSTVVMGLAQMVLGLMGVNALLKTMGGGTAAAAGAGGGGALGAIGGAIGGLSLGALAAIAAIILIIILSWDRFMELVEKLGTIIWDVVTGTFDNIVKFIGGIIKIIGGIILSIIGIFQMVWGIITGDQAAVTEGWENFVAGLGLIFEGICDVVSAVFDEVKLLISGLMSWMYEITLGAVEMLTTALYKIVTWIIETFMPDLKEPWQGFVDWLSELWTGMKDSLTNSMQPILDIIATIQDGIDSILGGESGGGSTGGGSTGGGSSGGGWLDWLPKFAGGGFVPVTTPAMVHAGEYVVPRGGALVSEGGGGDTNTVNVYANVSEEIDIDYLANEIARIWHNDFNRRNV